MDKSLYPHEWLIKKFPYSICVAVIVIIICVYVVFLTTATLESYSQFNESEIVYTEYKGGYSCFNPMPIYILGIILIIAGIIAISINKD